MAMATMEKPILFLTTTSDGKFQINQEAKDILKQIDNWIAIVSIVGSARSGKSYIMNRLFGKNNGFNLGHSMEAETKGIWMWAKPHPLDDKLTLVLLDSEGLNDPDKADDQHDKNLFSFILLLSSTMIYNVKGVLDEAIFRDLQFVTELTKHIKISDDDKKESGDKYKDYFPKLVFLIRDVYLELKSHGKKVTAKEYMEDALKLKTAPRQKESNEARKCITKYFPERDCFVLCRPVNTDESLQKLDKINDKDLTDKFTTQSNQFVEDILKLAKAKFVEKNFMNGFRYIELTEKYVNAVNNSEALCIKGAAKRLKEEQIQKAATEAMNIFIQNSNHGLKGEAKQSVGGEVQATVKGKAPADGQTPAEGQAPVEGQAPFKGEGKEKKEKDDDQDDRSQKTENSDDPLNSDQLGKVLAEASKAARTHFIQNEWYESEEDKSYLDRLMELIGKSSEEIGKKNEEISKKKCEKLLANVTHTIQQNIIKGTYNCPEGSQKYKYDKDEAIKKYNDAPNKGPMTDHVLKDYLVEAEKEEAIIVENDTKLTEEEKKKFIEEEKRKKEEIKKKEENDKLMEQIRQEKEAAKKEQEEWRKKLERYEGRAITTGVLEAGVDGVIYGSKYGAEIGYKIGEELKEPGTELVGQVLGGISGGVVGGVLFPSAQLVGNIVYNVYDRVAERYE